MRYKYLFFIIALILATTGSILAATESFWLCFKDSLSRKYLMQIDALGNVVLPPQKISELGQKQFAGDQALSFNGNNALNLWFNPLHAGISRYVLNVRTLETKALVQTNQQPVDTAAFISATQRKDNNFISFAKLTNEGRRIAAFPVDVHGIITGHSWFLSPVLSPLCENITFRCRGGVSSNGRVAFWTDIHGTRTAELFIQILGNRGRPKGTPVLVDRIFSRTVIPVIYESADISDILDSNVRYVVYITAPPEDDGRPQTIKLQKVDGVNGALIGSPITLFKASIIGQNLKVDRKGRFIVFTRASINYLALDATGHASGAPRVILPTFQIGGLDLLPTTLP